MAKQEDTGEATALALSDKQIENAKALSQTWNFDGADYALFVANKTGNVGSPIIHPVSKKQVAVLIADFTWESDKPFIDHLNYNFHQETRVQDDEAIDKSANFTTLNTKLFEDVVAGGRLIKINEFGENSEPIEKTRDEMLAYSPEIQSQLIDDWLGNFHIERYFPEGTDEIDAMLSNVDTIFFTAKIGNDRNPAHVLLFEFNAPSPDARRNFENDAANRGVKQKDNKTITTLYINQNARLNFARKHFRSVQGAVVGPSGHFEPDTSMLKEVVESDAVTTGRFKECFNSDWWMKLAGPLSKAFNFSGK